MDRDYSLTGNLSLQGFLPISDFPFISFVEILGHVSGCRKSALEIAPTIFHETCRIFDLELSLETDPRDDLPMVVYEKRDSSSRKRSDA